MFPADFQRTAMAAKAIVRKGKRLTDEERNRAPIPTQSEKPKSRITKPVAASDKRRAGNRAIDVAKKTKESAQFLDTPVIHWLLKYDDSANAFEVKQYASEQKIDTTTSIRITPTHVNVRGDSNGDINDFRCLLYLDTSSRYYLGKNFEALTKEDVPHTLFYRGDDAKSEIGKEGRTHHRPAYHQRAWHVCISSFQKLVRCEETETAMACAQGLMQTDFMSFLRRLMIIIPEDGPCFPTYERPLPECYPVLAWMLMAGNHFRPSTFTASWILGLVRSICDPSSLRIEVKDYPNKLRIASHVRSVWGGMPGDMQMLKRTRGIWVISPISPFTNSVLTTKKKIQQAILWDKTPHLSISLMPLEGVDFHCFKQFPQKCLNEGPSPPTASLQDIKRCIWVCRSGIRKKQPRSYIQAKLTRIFADYKETMDNISRSYIRFLASMERPTT